jgi:hypothetical protein
MVGCTVRNVLLWMRWERGEGERRKRRKKKRGYVNSLTSVLLIRANRKNFTSFEI